MNDSFNLKRFLDAQDEVYDEVCAELQRGQKYSHWMWFVFPQLKGLGNSPMAQQFAIRSRAEAAAYLAHPILGPRLRECTQLVNAVDGRSIEQIFGAVDALKFRSSITLFSEVAEDKRVFTEALRKYYSGEPDQRTLDLL